MPALFDKLVTKGVKQFGPHFRQSKEELQGAHLQDVEFCVHEWYYVVFMAFKTVLLTGQDLP